MSDPRPVAPREISQVARALSAGLAAAPDDLDHPDHDHLTAFVDGRLDEADVEWIETHLELCAICATDVADLIEMQTALRVSAPTAPRTWSLATVGAIAASLTLVVSVGWWMTRQVPTAPVSTPEVAAPVTTTAAVSVLTPEEQVAVERALASGSVEWPAQMAVLKGRVGTLLGDVDNATTFRPTGPTGTAVRMVRPQFSWTPRADATSYSVAVFNSQFQLVADSGPVTVIHWTPTRDLPRGQVLAWQVTAHRAEGDVVSPAPPLPEARFLVLSAEEVASVDTQRVRLADEPLALGLMLAKAGLVDEAKAALTRALTDSRYDSTAVQALLRFFS